MSESGLEPFPVIDPSRNSPVLERALWKSPYSLQ